MCRQRDILVRTTMILGFPGETDAPFQELLSFVKEARFARLGAFTFSPEEGTPAAEMPHQVPEAVKRARLDQLMLLQQEKMCIRDSPSTNPAAAPLSSPKAAHRLFTRVLRRMAKQAAITFLKVSSSRAWAGGAAWRSMSSNTLITWGGGVKASGPT